jgi:hypothetical protein
VLKAAEKKIMALVLVIAALPSMVLVAAKVAHVLLPWLILTLVLILGGRFVKWRWLGGRGGW